MARGRHTPDVVVVGGGIAGAFSAYFLALLGARPILVERDGIGAHASGQNSGGLNPLHGPGIPGPMQELALRSFRLHREHWDAVRRLSGADFAPRVAPRLHVALDEQDLGHLDEIRGQHASTDGFSANWMERDELLRREPRLSPATLGGLLTEGNGSVDGGSYTRALADAAVALGATTIRAEARGLRVRGDRVTGVETDSGLVSCDGLVIATGPWCERPARWLDTPLPVEALKGELLHVGLTGPPVESELAWRDTAVHVSARGEIVLGGTEDRVGFDPSPSTAARASILERIAQLLPGLGDVRVLRQTAALRPVTPDGLPIVGPAPAWENVCLALGAGRKGVLLSAAMGRTVAELLVRGGTELPVECCSPQREALRSTAEAFA